MTSKRRAASATVRVIGPIASWVSETGMIPARLTRPLVGRIPTKALAEAGDRIEFTVSLPVPASARFAATAAPVPPLEPPGVRVKSYGLSVWPPSELTVVPDNANSCMLDLPRIIAPALRSLATTKASDGGNIPASDAEPPVVGRSAVL